MTPHADHPPGPNGTWTIDLTHSSATLTWGRHRPGTITGRLHCLGIIHLDGLPPVGDIRFQQPSGLPVLTMALDPASVDTGDADLDTMLCGPDAFDVTRRRWWTLRSETLEVSPAEAGGSRQPSPPAAPQPWSSCASRSTPREATGWCCEAGACSTGGRSASAGHPRPGAPGSGSSWTCGPHGWPAPASRSLRAGV